jgi:hypothetical protein
MYETDKDGQTSETSQDAFSAENSVKLSLVVQMRIYDVLMALLNEQNEEVATRLYELHSDGKVLGSLPWLNIEPE